MWSPTPTRRTLVTGKNATLNVEHMLHNKIKDTRNCEALVVERDSTDERDNSRWDTEKEL